MNLHKRQLATLFYGVADFLMASLAWALFFLYRKKIEGVADSWAVLDDPNFYLGILIIPTTWVLLYATFGRYRDVYRLSRLATLTRTFFLSLIGVTLLFFMLVLDDVVVDYKTYYTSFRTLFCLHFVLTALSRMILLTRASWKLKHGLVTYRTLLVGGNERALNLYKEIGSRSKSLGNEFIGFIDTSGQSKAVLDSKLPCLGKIEDLEEVMRREKVEEVIIAIETSEHDRLQGILNTLFDFGDQVLVKIIPDMYDILLGTVKMNHVFGAVLIEIRQELMPHWQRIFKRLFDVAVSSTMLLLLSPLLLFIAIRVRFSSKGPIFFSQKRVGLNSKPFTIFKFRSMYTDAESRGPQLSQENDPRCTPWGAVMRKWRLDEIPNFYNVLRGDMSLVGPRPERKFYIDQLKERNPLYKHLFKVRPGITSWGQVKYGYASTVDEMLQRLKFDLLYIENMSLALDFKILFYTALVLLQGRGK